MTYQPKVYRTSGGDRQVVASGGELDIESGAVVTNVALSLRDRATAAQVNAGKTILDVEDGYKFRLVDCIMIAVGDDAGTATGVQVKCGGTVLIDAKVAALTQSTVARAGDSDVDVLADGASFVTQGDGDDVTVVKDGDDLATATHIDVILSYVLEKA